MGVGISDESLTYGQIAFVVAQIIAQRGQLYLPSLCHFTFAAVQATLINGCYKIVLVYTSIKLPK